jgi:hypothetical protein
MWAQATNGLKRIGMKFPVARITGGTSKYLGLRRYDLDIYRDIIPRSYRRDSSGAAIASVAQGLLAFRSFFEMTC